MEKNSKAIKYIRQHADEGVTRIAKALHTSNANIRAWAAEEHITISRPKTLNNSELMLKLRNYQYELDYRWGDYIREHYDAGVKFLENATGLTWRTIQNIAKRTGTKLRQKKRIRVPRVKIVELSTSNKLRSCKECACLCNNHCIYGFMSFGYGACETHRQRKLD